MKLSACGVLLCLALAGAGAAADESIAVLEEAPEGALELGEVSASSRQFSGRTDAGKQNYVLRELRRRAARLGGNALVLDKMQHFDRQEPRYGRLPGQMQYEKIREFRGRATVLRVPGGAELPVPESLEEP